jgi:FixJ family two-component response regulator
MSGRAVADSLRRVRPEIKVILSSGHPDEVIGRHGILDGSIAFLRKPFTARALAAKIRKALDQPAVVRTDAFSRAANR